MKYTLTQNIAIFTLNARKWGGQLVFIVTHQKQAEHLNLFCVFHERSCLFLECRSHISGGITPLILPDGSEPLWSLETTRQLP